MKVCVGCIYEYDWTEPLTAIPEGCKGCKMVDGKPSSYRPKPQTNADRIRAMSDEKLAKLFMDFAVKCYDDCGVSAEIITTDYVMEWLNQPAE